ncbi:UvrD-helicase domain-containing protein [Deinococcus arcticus]|uniref:DNA 3'-5' helicase n=1 Tax=Deinococcus arcticus TaxID=2136176 RepID=A0A2T3WC87_9DEIO|nr:UvrD-helicase domain-containing protein [Deinococcus arcticus]PTA69353.1 DNA helicase UvrD [Deinococcus arcticus]
MTAPDLLSQLNPTQAQAADHFTGPALVIAGAGSGKTRTLIYRIAHLIGHYGVNPGEILAVTFTNKAAAEMRERASHLVPGADKLWMSTFHSAGVRILRAYGEHIGLKRGFVIYDDDDQLDLLKEIMGSLPGIGPETSPRVVRGILDRAKSNLLTPADLDRSGEPFISGIPREAAAEAYRRYEARKKSQNAIDFGDLITETVRLFREVPGVLNAVQNRAKFIHVDEYQDTNRAQYELTRLLASRDRNLLVVGDPDQCLPPETLISTPQGQRPIAEIREGDTVCGVGAAGVRVPVQVTHVKRGFAEGPLWQVKAGEQTLRGTPHHVVLARHQPMEGQWYVYLMYREDRGYRIGLTVGARQNSEGQLDYGCRVRLNQENGDKVWVLRTCTSRAEAAYWEALYAARYGLPTALFHGQGRNLALGEVHLVRLFAELDTRAAAQRLMADLHLHPEFPHHRPQNGVRRQSLNLVMFQDFRRGSVGYHRIQWSSNRAEIAQKLKEAGHAVRDNGRGGYRLELSRKDYVQALQEARQIAQDGGLELQRKAQIGGQIYAFMPLSHLHPGMRMLAAAGGELREVAVDEVTQMSYSGPVYDLTVTPTHTYLAQNLLVHNSIYKFRGADIQNILDFQKDYHDAKVYLLEHNYRSSARVLTIANKLIENNAERLDKTLKPVKEDGHPVVFHRATDHRAEGDFVAEWITRLHNLEGRRLRDMAILYRTNVQSRVMEESLRRVQIPAKIVGGVGFYDRREIKDILAYARLAINPSDDVALRRIIGRPKRGIGDTALEKLLDWARVNGTSLLTACANAEQARILDRGAQKPVDFARLMEAMSDAADNYEPAQFLRYVIETSGYLDLLRQEGPEGAVRMENLDELINAAQEWAQEHEGTIADFLDDAALLSSVDDMRTKAENKGAPEDAVTLMTLHNAKGLEFPVVFIVGAEEGLLPSRGALVEAGGIEEERRLFYVGITRAMERLFLTAAQNRMQFGKTNAAEDSRFLEEIEGHFDTIDPYGQVIEYRAKTWKTYRPTVPAAVKNTSPLTNEMAYRGGEKVRHPKFGEGQVLAVAGVGDRQEVTVHFPTAGTKKLLVKFANLTAV